MRIRFFRAALTLALVLPFLQAQAVIDDAVAAQGLIVPKGGLIKVAAPAGQTGQPIVLELKVAEGDVVKAGQVIATLATRPAAEAQLATTQAEAAVAEKAVAIVEAQLAVVKEQVVAAQAELEPSKAQVAAAEAGVAEAQSGVAQAEAAVTQAQKGRIEALEKLDAGMARITGTRAVYQNQLDEFDPPRREAEEIKFQQKLLNEELRELSASRGGTVARLDAEVAAAEAGAQAARQSVESAEAQVATAKAQLAAAQAEIRSAEKQVAVVEAELARAQAAAKAAQAGIAQVQAQLALTQVTAPGNGTVLHIGARNGEAVGPQGVAIIGDLSQLYVDVEIYIDDVRKVKVGQKATLESDAFQGKLNGVLEQVGALVNPQGLFSNDPLAYTDQRVVTARIRLEKTDIDGWKPPVHAQVIARIQP
ncbi:MAG: efflux RND transporter periplasmic adaptor subunit [Puniceicoccales bacterium]